MITVGLTGGIGSGKSYIAEVFRKIGVPVFTSDDEAKLAYQDHIVRKQVIELLGTEAYQEELLNTSFISAKIFDNSELLQKLNDIIHPWVEKEFRTWADRMSEHAYIIKEAAILFETGIYKKLDYTICVTAPVNIRVSRVISRDNSNKETVLKRINQQWLDEKKIPLADYIIQNDGSQLVLPQILTIHNSINKKL